MPSTSVNIMKTAVRMIFVFVLSLCIALGGVLGGWQYWFFSGDGHTQWFTEEDYASMLADIQYAAESATIPTGMGMEVLDDVFTVNRIKNDVWHYYNSTFGGKAYKADTSDLEEKLSQQVWDFIEENEIRQTDSTPKLVNSYVNQVMEIYVNYINLPPVQYLAEHNGTIHKVVTIGLIVSGGIALVMIVLIGLLRQKFLPSISYAFGGAALMLCAAPGILLMQQSYRNLQVTPAYFKNYLVQFFSNGLQRCLDVGAICFEIMLIFVLLSAIPFHKLKRRSI